MSSFYSLEVKINLTARIMSQGKNQAQEADTLNREENL